MEILLDCLPCTLRQAFEVSKIVTDCPELQGKIMESTLEILSHYKEYRCSPDMVRDVYVIVKEITGISDPYKKMKERHINEAKKMYPLLANFLQKKKSNYWALKIAAMGNIIDSAINNNVDIEDCINKELETEFAICDIELFENKLKTAKKLLIIGDNAGETVFDRALTEHLSFLDITYAVRSEPVINDAIIEDAYASGLGDYTKIISTGCNAPGAILEECSTEFLNIFHSADIIISKGQGNFEALSDCGNKVFFLLKAKCHMISKKFGVGLNEYVFQYDGNLKKER